MTDHVEFLLTWLHVCLIIAAICATAFPVLYAFSPWYRSVLGRALMIQAVAFALAIDVTLLFQYWYPKSVDIIFWCNAVVFTLIAAATLFLTIRLWQINYRIRRNEEKSHGRRFTDRGPHDADEASAE